VGERPGEKLWHLSSGGALTPGGQITGTISSGLFGALTPGGQTTGPMINSMIGIEYAIVTH
jgi:hypothetical protein